MMTEEIFIPSGITPSEEQLAIQLARVRYALVEANAGAAKTTTLALRIAQALLRGAAPERILALTYTDTAVVALHEALLRIGVRSSAVARLQLATFDTFSRQRLAALEGGGVIACKTPEQVKPYVLRAIERAQTLPDEPYPDELLLPGSGEGVVEGLLTSFDVLKGTLCLVLDRPEQRMSPAVADDLGLDYASLRVFTAFEFIRRGGHPDHPAFRAPGDATYDLARLIAEDELDAAQGDPLELGLNLVVLDEMHDTNRAMFTVLARLLACNPRAVFLGVGDRDQAIHSAAGADAGFMGAGFDSGIARATRFALTATFRFGAALAQCAGMLARKPYGSSSRWQTAIEVLPVADALDMSRQVARAIKDVRAPAPPPPSKSKSKSKSKSIAGGTIAALVRQPHLSIPLENQFLRDGIHYRTTGFTTYLLRREVLLVRGLQAYAANDFSGFDAAPTRVAVLQSLMLFAGSFIDSEELRLVDKVAEQTRAMCEVAQDSAGMAVFVENHVLRNAGADVRRHLLDAVALLRSNDVQALAAGLVQALNPRKLASRVLVRGDDIDQVEQNVTQLLRSGLAEGSIDAMFRVLHELESRQRLAPGKDAVLLSSIEAAKGLEFDHVFLPGLNQGDFAMGGDSTENRNLLYVGMTRARRRLTVLYDPSRPSRYLRDAGLLP